MFVREISEAHFKTSIIQYMSQAFLLTQHWQWASISNFRSRDFVCDMDAIVMHKIRPTRAWCMSKSWERIVYMNSEIRI